MIRVNLLKPRISAGPGAPDAGNQPGKRPAFISQREVALGVFLLTAGGTAMFVYFGGNGTKEVREASPATADTDRVEAPGGEAGGTSEFTPAGADSASPSGMHPPVASETAVTAPEDGPAPAAASSLVPTTADEPRAIAAPTPNPSKNATPPKVRLSALNISNRDGDLKMTLVMNGRPSYNKFQLDKPNRVVIDIADTRVSLERSHLIRNVDHPLVRRIRLGQFKEDPWVTRLVLDVSAFPNLLLFPHSGGLDIQVSTTGQ